MKYLVVRVDVVDLDAKFGDLPESYDDALGTYAAPIPAGETDEEIESYVEELIHQIDGGQ